MQIIPEKKKMAALVLGGPAPSDHGDEDGLHEIMREFLSAVEAKDAEGMAEAFRNAFDVLESMPHEEAEHE